MSVPEHRGVASVLRDVGRSGAGGAQARHRTTSFDKPLSRQATTHRKVAWDFTFGAVAERKLAIPIVKRFPLAQAREAQELAEHHAGGKVILTARSTCSGTER